MAGPMARWKVLTDLMIESNQADGIALKVQKIGHGGSQGGGIFRFRVAFGAVAHRSADVGNQHAAKIGFVFELLNKVTVAARVNTPIQISRIVIGCILAVFSEFSRKAV